MKSNGLKFLAGGSVIKSIVSIFLLYTLSAGADSISCSRYSETGRNFKMTVDIKETPQREFFGNGKVEFFDGKKKIDEMLLKDVRMVVSRSGGEYHSVSISTVENNSIRNKVFAGNEKLNLDGITINKNFGQIIPLGIDTSRPGKRLEAAEQARVFNSKCEFVFNHDTKSATPVKAGSQR
jgi:hypothetical protein